MDNIQIKGRVASSGNFTSAYTADNKGVVLRIGHDSDFAFWCEVYIPKEKLWDMLQEVMDERSREQK